jgi:hypothetical protein
VGQNATQQNVHLIPAEIAATLAPDLLGKSCLRCSADVVVGVAVFSGILCDFELFPIKWRYSISPTAANANRWAHKYEKGVEILTSFGKIPKFYKVKVMPLAEIVILVFLLLELSNVLALYFAPGSKYANAVGVFTAWEKSKQYPEIHDFIKYLVYWVAGAKLIFLMLLGMVIIFADLDRQRMSLLALAIATASFYWRLFPLIRKMDKAGQITPKNYSTLLGFMILVFIAVFVTAIIL